MAVEQGGGRGRTRKEGAHHIFCKHEDRKQTGNRQPPSPSPPPPFLSKPSPTGGLPPARLYHLNLPKHCHQLGTMCSKARDGRDILIQTIARPSRSPPPSSPTTFQNCWGQRSQNHEPVRTSHVPTTAHFVIPPHPHRFGHCWPHPGRVFLVVTATCQWSLEMPSGTPQSVPH